jgi:putative transposase
MTRKYRIVVENSPHHVIQRGSRRQKVFFCEDDKTAYLKLLKAQCKKNKVLIWAYCLMENHVHLVLVPADRYGLTAALAQAHWHYARFINKRENWSGHLWQDRFGSFVLNDHYLRKVVRYVELNPVRGGLARKPELYKWSSARAHVDGTKDPYLDHLPLLDDIDDWSEYLRGEVDNEDLLKLRKHASTGRPLGGKEFLEELSRKLNIEFMPKRRGRKVRLIH